ncbi:MAG: GAF domain-containing sensor histidine kinase [Steroidobacteraceae bacterium]
MEDSRVDIAAAVAAVGRIGAIPTLLKVLCESTGMRFAAVARVTGNSWTVCAMQDDIPLGLKAGEDLPIDTALCMASRATRTPIIIENASTDPHHDLDRSSRLRNIQSYVTVPIVMADGRYFGNLCALDTAPAQVALPRIISMFQHFAALIGSQLDAQLTREKEHSELVHERASSELREQFIAILGHDLRNPLQAVFATADLLERRLTNKAHAEMASRIKTNVRRMSVLIDDVLDFARARLGGGIGVELKNVNTLDSNLNAVVQELQDAHPDRRIIANISVSRTVRCDIGRVQQVASNLIANALTHGEARSPVRFLADTRADGLIIEVWNAGEPIPTESIDKIFEPFWRHSVSGNRQGLGLGLHICAHIVRAHEGRISVSSTREEGTRFTVWLPLERNESARGDATTQVHMSGMPSVKALREGAGNNL